MSSVILEQSPVIGSLFLPEPQVILKEREERKHRRLLEERGLLPEDESQPANDPGEEEECDTSATGQSYE